jgi:hypothetical protein
MVRIGSDGCGLLAVAALDRDDERDVVAGRAEVPSAASSAGAVPSSVRQERLASKVSAWPYFRSPASMRAIVFALSGLTRSPMRWPGIVQSIAAAAGSA